MRSKIITLMTALVGLINFIPVLGLLSAEKIGMSYGIEVSDPNVAVLMRHRAVLFGLLGGFILYTAIKGEHRLAGLTAGLIAMVAYAVLVLQMLEPNDQLLSILNFDYAGIAFAIIGIVLLKVSPTSE